MASNGYAEGAPTYLELVGKALLIAREKADELLDSGVSCLSLIVCVNGIYSDVWVLEACEGVEIPE